jgi:hypothetical protein
MAHFGRFRLLGAQPQDDHLWQSSQLDSDRSRDPISIPNFRD